MKKIARLLAVLLILSTGLPLRANAVSFSPIQAEREEKAAKGIMRRAPWFACSRAAQRT